VQIHSSGVSPKGLLTVPHSTCIKDGSRRVIGVMRPLVLNATMSFRRQAEIARDIPRDRDAVEFVGCADQTGRAKGAGDAG
jgi:hypothetical protein